ncbi:MAG: hypothetical protein NTW50_03925, partial [Candidatus Berkelbacteria bacterium]|nr:hypothetical protein [Candidatus Berkelbacteria bacterium]
MNQIDYGQVKSTSRNKSNIWIIVIAVVATAILVGGGTWYFLNKKATSDKKDLQAQIDALGGKTTVTTDDSTATTTTPSDTASDPTTSWKTLTDSHYSLSLKYPDSWPTTTTTYMTAAENDFLGVAASNANFVSSSMADKGKIRNVDISKLSDFTDTTTKAEATQMKTVYSSKSASGATGKIYLGAMNAAIAGATAPTYIETTDGKFRGIYYFASIGQDYSTTIDCVIVMTDNTNSITFHFALPSDKAKDYTKADGTINPTFLTYVQALTTSSTETIVTEFNSTYKYMALSLAASTAASTSTTTTNTAFTLANLKSASVTVDGKAYQLADGKYTSTATEPSDHLVQSITLDQTNFVIDSANPDQAAIIL